ncbi:MAG: beta-carotene 15,15'-dioxygenase, Brp/Blh family [Flavobacteriaceae bacterium]|nr:beta-carotene 15,15'-dioxygenase, Brp/Blh family [Flavobacteriaceae bacterium]
MIFQATKYYQISILVTFLFILVVPLLSDVFTDFLWGFAVLTLGILHGANDLEIISKSFKGKLNHLYFKSILVYILVVLLGAVFFFTLPGLALIIFVMFSSYHFGEEHWEDRLPISVANFVFYILYGAFLFFLMFSLQYEPVVEVIQKISGRLLPFEFFLYTAIGLGITLLTTMLFHSSLRPHLIKECLILVLLSGIFYVGSLLFAFAFYFVVWHSFPSLLNQLKFLYGDMNFKSFIRYFKHSIIYWLASLISLYLVYRYMDFEADYFMPLFFSFLAAITFPHTIVMGMMKHKNG